MADYLNLLTTAQPALFEKYFRLSNAAGLERPVIVAHAMRIQRLWRGYRDRKYLRFLNNAARQIQRVYRGHRGRRRALDHRVTRANRDAKSYYDAMATVIQKVWRGVVSRGTKQDFYQRKKYLNDITNAGRDMTAEVDAKTEAQREELALLTLQANETEFRRVTAGLHHMLSTKAQAGFFRSPFGDAYNPTAFNVPIEAHLKDAFSERYPQVRRHQKAKYKAAPPNQLAGSTFQKAASASRGSSRAATIGTGTGTGLGASAPPTAKPYQRLNAPPPQSQSQQQLSASAAAESKFDAEMNADADRDTATAAATEANPLPPTTGVSTAPPPATTATKTPLTTSLARPLTLTERAKLLRSGAVPGIDFCADRSKYKPVRCVDPIDEIRESEGGVASDSTDPRASQMALEAVFGADSVLAAQTIRREEAKRELVAARTGAASSSSPVVRSGTAFFDTGVAPPIVTRTRVPHSAAARQHLLAVATGTHTPAIGSAAASIKAAQAAMRTNLDDAREREEEWKRSQLNAGNHALVNRPPFVVNPKTKPAPSKVSVVVSEPSPVRLKGKPTPPKSKPTAGTAAAASPNATSGSRSNSKSNLFPALPSAVPAQ